MTCRVGVTTVTTTTTTTTTVPAIATVVAVTALMIIATTTVPTVMCAEALGAPTKRTGRHGGSSSEGHFGNDLGLVGEHGQLESEHGACLPEGKEWGHVGDVVSGDGELGVEAADEVEDELSLQNGMADITERVAEGVDMLVVVGDGGVPLNKSVKLIAKGDCTHLLVVVEEVRDHDVEGTSGLIIVVHGEGKDGVIDRGLKPDLDGVVGLCPHGIRGMHQNHQVEEGKEPKLPDHGLEESAPAGEVWPVQIEGDQHMCLDVDRAEGVDDGRGNDVGDESAGGECARESHRGARCVGGGHGGGSARVLQRKRWRLGLGSVVKKKALIPCRE
jgi:hypothetical protein